MTSYKLYDPIDPACQPVGSTALQRVNLHSLDSGLQVMVLHMDARHTYDFILDDCAGLISFTVISGCLFVETLDDSETPIKKKYCLTTGCVLLIPRNIYRKTYTTDSPACYVEHIENGFRPDCRIKRTSAANDQS